MPLDIRNSTALFEDSQASPASPSDRMKTSIEHYENNNDRGKPKYRRTTCLSATASSTNPTQTDQGFNPGFRGKEEVIYSQLAHMELVRTSQKTKCASERTTNRGTPLREKIAVYCENHMNIQAYKYEWEKFKVFMTHLVVFVATTNRNGDVAFKNLLFIKN